MPAGRRSLRVADERIPVVILCGGLGTRLAEQKKAAESGDNPLILGPDHPLAAQAYRNQ